MAERHPWQLPTPFQEATQEVDRLFDELIPASNAKNVILRADVMDAIEHGQFHIYPIKTIDQGIELLSGMRAGSVEEEDTINGRVSQRLHDLANKIRKFGSEKKEETESTQKTSDEEKTEKLAS